MRLSPYSSLTSLNTLHRSPTDCPSSNRRMLDVDATCPKRFRTLGWLVPGAIGAAEDVLGTSKSSHAGCDPSQNSWNDADLLEEAVEKGIEATEWADATECLEDCLLTIPALRLGVSWRLPSSPRGVLVDLLTRFKRPIETCNFRIRWRVVW